MISVAVLAAAACLAVQSPQEGRAAPWPGSAAPGFALKRIHSEERVSLAQFRGSRPVALVFGSYT